MGPLRKKIFPYEWHYQTINNHILLDESLTGNAEIDIPRVLKAFASGNLFIGYDLPMPAHGFRFYASRSSDNIPMGEEIYLNSAITLQISPPGKSRTALFCDGQSVAEWHDKEKCTFIVTEPGVYRCECYLHYLGKERTWIVSNPIYIRDKEVQTTFMP